MKKENTDQVIGNIWYCYNRMQSFGFLPDIEIFENFQGKGYGTEVTSLIDDKMKELAMRAIIVKIFTENSRVLDFFKK